MPDIPVIESLRAHFGWAPPWVFSLLVLAAVLVAALVGYTYVVRAVARGVRRRSDFTRSLIVRTREPARLAILLAAVGWGAQLAPFEPQITRFIQHAMVVGVIVLCGWMVLTAADIGMALYMRKYRVDIADNLL